MGGVGGGGGGRGWGGRESGKQAEADFWSTEAVSKGMVSKFPKSQKPRLREVACTLSLEGEARRNLCIWGQGGSRYEIPSTENWFGGGPSTRDLHLEQAILCFAFGGPLSFQVGCKFG